MAQSLSSAAEHNPISNSAARADTIREAVQWLADKERQVQAINADIREYRTKHIKGDLGFKLSDWAAIYRVSQLEVEDRDALIDTLREGFAALGIGQVVDWVAAAEVSPLRRRNGTADTRFSLTGLSPAAPDEALGNGADEPKRRRGRPRKQQQAEADAEF